jgi:hypothetical protein
MVENGRNLNHPRQPIFPEFSKRFPDELMLSGWPIASTEDRNETFHSLDGPWAAIKNIF